jgi:TPP-dependent pyruvate/acetoin dehydrogenase alpha subunit
VGLQRSEVLQVWKKRDPIKRIVDSMIKDGEFTEQEFESTQLKIRNIINDAWLRAESSPFPSDKYLYSTLYSN